MSPGGVRVAVRLGSAADVDAAASVFLRSNLARRRGRPISPDRLEYVTGRLRDPASWFLVADEDGATVGMACAEALRADGGAGAVIPGVLFLGYVFIVPERWGQGIGGFVLDAALAEARRRAYHRIELWTHEEDNERAQRLYRSRGFLPTGLTQEDDTQARIGQWAAEIGLPAD
jgi:GNAT superfamily N-acetyltransferase